MKVFNFVIASLMILFLAFSCKMQDKPTDVLPPPAEVKVWTPEDIRDIPGLSFQRGLISNTDKATPGYVLFHPSAGTSTYLANLNGEIVHEWKGENNSMLSYLMNDGKIIRLERDPNFPTFAGGGQAGRIREYTWDGEMTWDFAYISKTHLIHHDIAIMPNGNILAISWDAKTKKECIAAGCNPEALPEDGLWFDKIIEIEPTRPSGGKIVWEWNIWDHMVQNHDSSKKNYGDPAKSIRKVNINPYMHPIHMTKEQVDQMIKQGMATSNATPGNQGSDLTHLNSIEYNADLDQIVVSSPHFNELYILDHSTTTAEAKGDKGGKYGHGGDLLYRWGNPQNYGRGTAQDQQIFGQHDVRWIPKGFPGEGHLTLFNNDIYDGKGKYPSVFMALAELQNPNISMADVSNYSAVFELEIPLAADGNYEISDTEAFGPTAPVWTYKAPDLYSLYAPFVSSAHRMKNGNTFVNEGPRGRLFEVTPDGEVVWDYRNPYFMDHRLPDGSMPQPTGPFFFAQFRVEHIGMDHPAIQGKELKAITPQPEVFVPKPPPAQ